MMEETKFSIKDLAENYFTITPDLINSAIHKLETDGYLLSYLYGKPLVTYPTNKSGEGSWISNLISNEETEQLVTCPTNDSGNGSCINDLVLNQNIKNDIKILENNKINEKSYMKNQRKTFENILYEINSNFWTIEANLKANLNYETKMKIYEDKIQKAVKNKTIFTIYGNWPIIREALLQRGWIEKINSNYLNHLQNTTNNDLIQYATEDNDYEKVILSNMLENYTPNFIYGCLNRAQYFSTKLPYISNIKQNTRNLSFTNKEGLIECIKKTYKYNTLSDIRTPIFHRLQLTIPDENLHFLRDYRTLYCLSLLTFICKEGPIEKFFNTNGSMPLRILKMATDRVRAEIKYRQLRNSNISKINHVLLDDNDFSSKRWNNFIYSANQILQRKVIFLYNNISELKKKIKYNEMNRLVKEAEKYWPSLSSNGYNNLWILKPSNESRGRGITIKNQYLDIINYVRLKKYNSYIVQKYIEKPFLIYNTKFDIRQHILISISYNTLQVWMYKDCYLRFCSHQYKITHLHESIHLTNHSIQKNYKNGKRNSNLPSHNMWSLKQFQLYLYNIYQPDTWNNQIYTKMKKMIIAIISASLDNIAFIPNTFELYGCDFMLDENLMPILIEINGHPDMSSSTIVTANLCPKILNDMILVIIDLPNLKSTSTGLFELIYEYNFIDKKANSL